MASKYVSKWIWRSSNTHPVERRNVIIADNKAYVQPNKHDAKKAEIVDMVRVFDTKEEAIAAAALGGRVVWTFTDTGPRWGRPEVDKIEVFRVKISELLYSYGNVSAVRIDAKGNRLGDGFMIPRERCFGTEAAARKALAEKLSEWRQDFEKELRNITAHVELVRNAVKAVERAGTKVPEYKSLLRRQKDRRNREQKKREARRAELRKHS